MQHCPSDKLLVQRLGRLLRPNCVRLVSPGQVWAQGAKSARRSECRGVFRFRETSEPSFNLFPPPSPSLASGCVREQTRDLLAQPELETTEATRDRAILAVLLGCALRRSELAVLESRHIQ